MASLQVIISEEEYGKITQTKLQDAINNQFGNNNAVVTENDDNSFIVKFNNSNREYEVSADGRVNSLEKVTDSKAGELAGKGTEDEPYLIESIEDLVWFANDVTTGNTYENKFVKLATSLNFKQDSSYVNPNTENFCGYAGKLKNELITNEGFKSIGIDTNTNQNLYSFAGTFDGNGKIIYNLYMNKSMEDNSKDLRIGLFGNNYGTIKNLGLSNCNIYGELDTTGTNTAILGGITGFNYGNINMCFVSGNISGVGLNNAKCRVGGISGSINEGIITNTYNVSNLNCLTNRTDNNGSTIVGGIVGYSTSGQVLNSYNTGSLETNSKGGNQAIGGIIGWATNITINNCYNISTLKSQGTARNYYAGGISARGASTEMNYCYSKTIINQNVTASNSYIGQIAGLNNSDGKIQNCYYFKSERYSGEGKNEGTGESVSVEKENEMPSILDIVGTNFKKGTSQYPLLNWQ